MRFKRKNEHHPEGYLKVYSKFAWLPTKLHNCTWVWFERYWNITKWCLHWKWKSCDNGEELPCMKIEDDGLIDLSKHTSEELKIHINTNIKTN
jgi:hypothetical protein